MKKATQMKKNKNQRTLWPESENSIDAMVERPEMAAVPAEFMDVWRC